MFNQFRPFYKFNDAGFIRNTKIYVCPKNRVILVDCLFDSNQFSFDLFQQLNIHLPTEVKGSVSKRLSEFLSGRYACKLALIQSGFTPPPTIDIGKNRAPLWPTGYQGSITHSDNKALCVIGKSCTTPYVGIDIENILTDTASEEISSQIHTNSELRLLLSSGIAKGTATTIIFSAKESLFKALYPYVKVYFGFDCAQLIDVSISNKQLTFQLNPAFSAQYQLNDIYHVYFDYNQSLVKTLIVT